MPDDVPPWDSDPLSQFFRDAARNVRVAAVNLPDFFDLLRNLNQLFLDVQSALEHDNRDVLLIPRFLVVRVYASILGAWRLAMSGQLPEAHAVLRLAIEQAWYALHMAKDPNPSERAVIWLNRNDDETAKGKCKSEFTITNVRATHRSVDRLNEPKLHLLYERVIDFGAHPNQQGLLSSAIQKEDEKEIVTTVGVLHPETTGVVVTLKTSCEVAIGTLKVIELMFPERFRIAQIDKRIDDFTARAYAVFQRYARQRT